MSIYDGKGLILWEDGLFVPGSDLLARVKWAFAQIRAAGGTILLNEAGRPFGVPSDQNVLYPWQTASGYSTVYYQWGRYLRGLTPSAANPALGANTSEHTQGIAIDCNAPSVFDATLRARFFAQVGLVNTISSESWHWAIRGPSRVDLTSIAGGSATALPAASSGEDEDMPRVYVQSQDPKGSKYAWIVVVGGGLPRAKEFSPENNRAEWAQFCDIYNAQAVKQGGKQLAKDLSGATVLNNDQYLSTVKTYS